MLVKTINIISTSLKAKNYVSNTFNLSENLINLYEINNKLLKNDKNTNINIGGDHSMSISTVGSSLNNFGSDVKVIWIDAHADINTYFSSPSKNFHGMPLSFLTGLDKFNDFYFIKNLLKFENLCYIGIRDLDPNEIKIIKKHSIKTIESKYFNTNKNKIFGDIIKWIDNKPIHLSIDVDSLDPLYMQFTGTRAPNAVIKSIVLKILFNDYIIDNFK